MLLTSAAILLLLCCDAESQMLVEGRGNSDNTQKSLDDLDEGQSGFNINNSVAFTGRSRSRRSPNFNKFLADVQKNYGLDTGGGNIPDIAKNFGIDNGGGNIPEIPKNIGLDKGGGNIPEIPKNFGLDNGGGNIPDIAKNIGLDKDIISTSDKASCWDLLTIALGTTTNADNLARTIIDVLEKCDLQAKEIEAACNVAVQLGEKYTSEIERLSPGDARTKSEAYLRNMVKVLGEVLDVPGEWRKLATDLISRASTSLLQSISKASLTVTDLVITYTKEFFNENLHVRAHSQFTDFFAGKERQYDHIFYSNTSVFLPKEFYDGYRTANDTVKVVFTSYRTLHTLGNTVPLDPVNVTEEDFPAKQQLNSGVISALVGEKGSWRSDKGKEVEVKLGHVYTAEEFHLDNITCAWWDEERLRWSTDGCYLNETNAYYSICRCNHLTSFAILMDIDGRLPDTKDPQSLFAMGFKWITLVGSSASCLCLCASLCCILATKSLRDATCWKVRGHLCVSLLFTQVLLLVGPHVIENSWLCLGAAVLLHYVLVCAFTWGSVESLNMYFMFAKVFRTSSKLPLYFFGIGYGFPALVIGITLGITRGDGYYTEKACWLAPGAMRWSFVGVLGFLLLINLAAFLLLIRLLVTLKQRRPSHSSQGSRLTDRIFGTVTIFLVLGLSWVTGFLYVFFGTEVMALIFALNSFQGVWIFLCGILFDRRIRDEIFKNQCRKPRKEFKSSENTKEDNTL